MNQDNQQQDKAEADNANELIRKQAFGVLLREARENKNISVIEIAEALRLTENNIKALENSQVDELPGRAFTLGYIRSYSRYLDIENQPIVDAYLAFYDQDETSLQSTAEKKSGIQKYDIRLLVISALILGLFVIFIFWPTANTPLEPEEGAEVIEHVKNVKPVQIPSKSSSLSNKSTGLNILKIKSQTQLKSKQTSVVAKLDQASADKIVLKNNVAELESEDILQLDVNADSWAEIKDIKGQRLFYNTLKTGENYQFKGQAPFSIFLGNAPGVSISVNHQDVDLKQHIKANNIAHLVITETAVVE